jgi:uncharacterized protein YjbI with pentapeptide repeats
MSDLEREKIELELKKLNEELSLVKQQELKLLKDEFWNKLSAQVEGLTPNQREIRGSILKDAFFALRQSSEGQGTPLEMYDEISNRYKGRKLSNTELIRALTDIDECGGEIQRQLDLLFSQELSFNELPYDERKKAREPVRQEQDELQSLMYRLMDLRGEILRSSLEPGMSLPNVNLESANLAGMNLSRVRLIDVKLRDANLSLVNFEYANLEDANLTLAKMVSANLHGACLHRACLNEADLRDANLEGADLSEADLTETNFTGANLCNAVLKGAEYCKGRKYSKDTIWPDGFDPEAAGARIKE